MFVEQVSITDRRRFRLKTSNLASVEPPSGVVIRDFDTTNPFPLTGIEKSSIGVGLVDATRRARRKSNLATVVGGAGGSG